MRRTLALLTLAVVLAPLTALAQAERNIYAPNGTYQGSIDAKGNIYAPNGAYRGNIDANGNVYAPNGTYTGSIGPKNALPSGLKFPLPYEEKSMNTKP